MERIEALAPDQASLTAARKLLKPTTWPTLAAGEGLIWSECEGSGSAPYRVVVSEVDAGYKCTCPSGRFPCKHSLALMWMRAEGKAAFTSAAVPDWVKDWLSRRRGPAAVIKKTETSDAAKPSIRLAESEPTVLISDGRENFRYFRGDCPLDYKLRFPFIKRLVENLGQGHRVTSQPTSTRK